ncbi:FtsX-like permease family protein [Saccharopolyspora soli]|uniref:FtsX-like permease family protein n=1 Tax=Saccharopolyspora soli TaxID=2926618 RepID=UPI001F5AB6A6|nr:ABC transporter permease [Saccharopolyspora soli]
MATHLRGVLRRPVRLVLTGLAIAVAAFFAMAALLTQDIAKTAALSTVTEIPPGAELVVSSPAGNPAALLREIRQTAGVAEATGRMRAAVTIGGSRVVLVADPGTGPLSRVRLTSGSYPTTEDQIAVSQRVALPVGSRVPLGTATVTVTGIVDAPSSDGAAVYSTDNAVLALVPAELSRVDITTNGPVDRYDAVTADEARASVISKAESKAEQLLAVLTAFVVVAVIAALLVAISTFRIVFAQRIRQLALLRTVGAPRRKLVRALVAEGGLTGFVAGGVGVLLALGLGHLVPALAGIDGPARSALAAPAVVLASTALTMLASLVPALAATRVSPLEALRSSSGSQESPSVGRLRVGIGLLLLVAAGFVITEMFRDGITDTQRPGGTTLDFLLLTIASGTLVFAALLALGPILLRPVLRGLGAVLAPFGPTARLAVRGVGGVPRRAAAVSAVVALGTGLLAGLLVAGDTVRSYNTAQVAAAFPADVELTGAAEEQPLPDGLIERLRERPEVGHVVSYRTVRRDATVRGQQRNFEVSDLDIHALPLFEQLRTVRGSLDVLGPGDAVVTEAYARALGVDLGGTIDFGPVRSTVAAVVVGESLGAAGVVLDHRDLDALGVDARPTHALVTAGDSQAQAVVRGVAGSAVQVRVLADQRAERSDLVALLTTLGLALLALTLLISIIGVGTTVALSVVERRRESGMLRALGITRTALGGITVAEAAVYGVLGGLFGLLIGVPHAWLAVLALGLGAPLEIPVPALLVAAVALVALTMAAGLVPAWRAARASPVAAMRVD